MSLQSTDTGFLVAATAPTVVQSARANLLVKPIAFVVQPEFSKQMANASIAPRANMQFKTESLSVHHATKELLTAQLVS